MPYGIVVSTSEADMVRTVWGDEGVPMISTSRNIVWFDPKRGRQIVTALSDFDFGDDLDPNAQRRLLARIADLCGKSLLETPQIAVANPVVYEPEAVHIEEEAKTEADDATD